MVMTKMVRKLPDYWEKGVMPTERNRKGNKGSLSPPKSVFLKSLNLGDDKEGGKGGTT